VTDSRGLRAVATTAAAAAVVIAAGLAAPAARAAGPIALPQSVTSAISAARLTPQISYGWEAVAGPATSISKIRGQASSLGIGGVAMYRGNNEAGRGILIFTGDDDSTTPATAFRVTGPAVASVVNGTDQAWSVFADGNRATPDATISAGTAENITPVVATLVDSTVFISPRPVPIFSF